MFRTGVVVVLWLSASAAQLRGQSSLPVVEDVDYKALRAHVRTLVTGLEKQKAALPSDALADLRKLLDKEPDDPDAASSAIQKMLDAHCIIGVSINPESRVKAARGPAVIELRQDEATFVLVKIQNDAGVTAALKVAGPQIVAPGKAGDGWLEASVVTEAPFAAKLGGGRVEYVVLKLKPREAGKREATFKFDVGQGTQDLGYRAEVPILFTVRTR
jgi:hypothetical protein